MRRARRAVRAAGSRSLCPETDRRPRTRPLQPCRSTQSRTRPRRCGPPRRRQRSASSVNAVAGSSESANRLMTCQPGSVTAKKRCQRDSAERPWKKSASAARSPGSERLTLALVPSRRIRRVESRSSVAGSDAGTLGMHVVREQELCHTGCVVFRASRGAAACELPVLRRRSTWLVS